MPEWLYNDIKRILASFKKKFVDSISVQKVKNSITVTANTTTIDIGLDYTPSTQILLVFKNGIYMEEDREYTVANNVITLNEELQIADGESVIFDLVLIKIK